MVWTSLTIRDNFCFKASKVRWLRQRRSNPLPPSNISNSSQKIQRQNAEVKNCRDSKKIYGIVPDPFELTLLVKESPRKFNNTTGRQTFRKNIYKKNGI